MKKERARFWRYCVTLSVWLVAVAGVRGQVDLSIGMIEPGEEVVITYEVTLGSPLLPGVTQISNQATVSGTGFASPKSTDDPETTTADDATVTVLQNDAPVLAAGSSVGYSESGAAVAIASALTVDDGDNANLASAAVSITSGFAAGDVLAFTDQNGIAGSYDGNAGVLTLSGTSSVANYQAALRSVTFANAGENPTDYGAKTSRTISFVVNDGIVDSLPATATINVTAENDAPVLAAGNSISYTENGAAIAVSPGITVEDVDSSNLANATVSITSGFVAGDTLGFSDQNGIVGSYDGGTGVLTLSGASSIPNYETALRSVTYSSLSEDPTALGAHPSRTVRFVANDGTDDSSPVIATIAVTAENDGPAGGDDTIQRAPNDDVKVKISTLLANDSDADGGTLSITAVTTPSGGGATVTLNGGWVFYTHVGNSADSFTYTLSDGQGGTTLVTVNVTIQGENTQSGPVLTPTVDGSGAHVTFSGIPGRSYTMQSALAPSGPWTDAGVATEDIPGHYTFTDPSVLPANFYRAVFRP